MSTPTHELLIAAKRRRMELQRQARRRSLALPSAVITLWTVAVLATQSWERVGANLGAAATMVFGSFVAGSTPQGGGAVAFPVFTKVFGIAADDARTFSLAIQAVGMGSAAMIIALTGRAVDRRALRLTVPGAIGGFLAGWAVLSVAQPPSAPLKITFTLLVAAAGAATVLTRRRPIVEHLQSAPLELPNVRAWTVLVAGIGGVTSAVFGSGADVAVYLLLTIALGVRPSIGVATSVVTMAAVSLVGLGTAVATGEFGAAVAGDVDLFGMWLAAVPVVVIGAPLGSWFAGRVQPATLATCIGVLAAAELASTVIFLEELRTDRTLLAFGSLGLAATSLGVVRLLRLRDRLASIRSDGARTLRRLDLELAVTP